MFSSLLAVLCMAVVRRVFRASVHVVSQRSFVYLAARRTIDCERNIVSIVVHPLSYWLFCARRWSAVSSVHLFVWLVNGHSCTSSLAGLLIASGILSLLSFILSPTGCSVHGGQSAVSSVHLFVWLVNGHSCTSSLAGLLIASGILSLLSFILSLLAVLCTAVVRRVFPCL